MRAAPSARDAIVVKFTKVLPGWLRRSGVQGAGLDDAVQEALAAALVKLRELPSEVRVDDAAARHELMRIVSNVALRARRHAQREGERYVSVAHIEMPTARDEEMWVDARMVILAAIEKLDEPARALIYAHEIEGKTYAEIAATLKVKEDAAEKRVVFAKQRLRAEIEKIERGWTSKRPNHDCMLLGLGFDPLERALVDAVYEALGKKPVLSPPTNMWSFVKPNFSTTVLAGTLALAPNSFSTFSTFSTFSAFSSTDGPTVGHEKNVVSVEVQHPGENETGAGLAERTSGTSAPALNSLPPVIGAWVSSSAIGTTSTVLAPATRVVPKSESNELSEKEKQRLERKKVWGGSNTPRFDDP